MFNNKLKYKIDAIRRLHLSYTEYYQGCSEPGCCGEDDEWVFCQACDSDYPCETIKILDGKQ